MSLYVKIGVNDEWLATVTATRRTSSGEEPESVNTYDVRIHEPNPPTDRIIGNVRHRYGDGAGALAAEAMRLAFVEGRLP